MGHQLDPPGNPLFPAQAMWELPETKHIWGNSCIYRIRTAAMAVHGGDGGNYIGGIGVCSRGLMSPLSVMLQPGVLEHRAGILAAYPALRGQHINQGLRQRR